MALIKGPDPRPETCNDPKHYWVEKDIERLKRTNKDLVFMLEKEAAARALLEAQIRTLKAEYDHRDSPFQRKLSQQARAIRQLERQNQELRTELFASQGFIRHMQIQEKGNKK